MDVSYFAEFGKLKYVHHIVYTYSGFQWATALSTEKTNSIITIHQKLIAIMDIPVQIKTDNTSGYISSKMKQFLHVTI